MSRQNLHNLVIMDKLFSKNFSFLVKLVCFVVDGLICLVAEASYNENYHVYVSTNLQTKPVYILVVQCIYLHVICMKLCIILPYFCQ